MSDPRVARLGELVVNYSLRLEPGKVLRVDAGERKIGLSRKRVDWSEQEIEQAAAAASAATAAASPGNTPASELKGGVGGESGPLIK